MNRVLWLLMSSLVFLAACKDDKQQVSFESWERVRVEYSYPYPDQQDVSVQAPLVLRFTHAVTPASASEVSLTVDNQAVSVEAELMNDGKGILITPTAPLAFTSLYELNFSGVEFGGVKKDIKMDSFAFTTRGAARGARTDRALSDGLEITRIFPDEHFPVMDFTSFRFQFSQPLDDTTVNESTVKLLGPDNTPVPTVIKTKHHYLTLDPQDDLVPGQEYRLELSDGITSIYGRTLSKAWTKTITPQDSQPRGRLWQQTPNSNETERSLLTGSLINKVPLKTVLLGSDSASQTEGNLFADLAFLPNFPDVSPLRVPRGSFLAGDNVDVLVGGKLDTGLKTGKVNVTFITDGVGYLMPNPHTDHPEVSKSVVLMMDVAMTAEEEAANGGLSQDLLHVELFGTMTVENGDMVINAIGVVEPDVLGLETAYGVMSFNVRAPVDQQNAPDPATLQDETKLELHSWLPGEAPDKAVIGNPIILNFSKPLAPESLADNVTLLLDDMPVDFTWRLDGASLVIHPDEGLQSPAHAGEKHYRVEISGEIKDLQGNDLEEPQTLAFQLPVSLPDNPRSPMPLTTYPGFPCVKQPAAVNQDSLFQGQCAGGAASDEQIPVASLPGNRPIRVQFSKNMNLDSIQLDNTFQVVRHVDGSSSGAVEPVPGHLRLAAQLLEFWPDEPWQEGQLYSYTLVSNGNRRSATVDCNQAMCSVDGLPLQTQWLAQSPAQATTATGGGNDLVNYFRGAAATDAVFQALRGLPTTDVNANLIHEASERQPDCASGTCVTPFNSAKAEKATNTGVSGGFITELNIGCAFGDPCPDKGYLYLTGALNGEVMGYDKSRDAVRVDIHPTTIHTSELFAVAKAGIGSLGLLDLEAPTGPQVMRIRYVEDDNGQRTLPVTAWIKENPEGGLMLEGEMELYMDAPLMEAGLAGILTVSHDLLSKKLSLKVSGPVDFLPDGRMHIAQLNTEDVSLDVKITPQLQIIISIPLLPSNLKLRIPKGGANLSFVSEAVKP